MKKLIIILVVLVVILTIVIGVVVYNFQSTESDIDGEEQESTSCTELGCSSGDIYVGSINSDKYYECECHYAQRILPENIICFAGDEEAIDAGYTKSDC